MTIKTAAWIMTLASISQILGYLYALPGHLDEHSWSAHAQFHHVLGWIWLTGLHLIVLVLIWGPLQRHERWAFWSVLAATMVAQGGHFITSLLVPAGRPSEWWYDYAIGVMALIAAAGLWIAWRALSKSPDS